MDNDIVFLKLTSVHKHGLGIERFQQFSYVSWIYSISITFKANILDFTPTESHQKFTGKSFCPSFSDNINLLVYQFTQLILK